MPSYHRGIDDDSHIWRIDVENDSRPPKRQRIAVTEIFEKYVVECGATDAMETKDASSSSCSSSEEEDMDASSLELSSDLIVCDENVGNILHDYIRNNNDVDILEEGLAKLLKLIGAKNTNAQSQQRHRMEMFQLGGHWMITDLLAALVRDDRYCYDAIDAMEDTGMSGSTVDDEVRAAKAVTQSCQILQQLLLTNPTDSEIQRSPSTNISATIRYQIYCAGGLDAVVSALKRFPTNFDVQLIGCQFLASLVSSKGSNDYIGINKSGNMNGSEKRSNSSPTTTLINNLYQATDKLRIIVRLLARGDRNSVQKIAGDSILHLSNTQIWQLYFVVADIVRSVVRQSPVDSTCRSEIVCTLEKHLIPSGCRTCESHMDTRMMDESDCGDNQNDKTGYHSGVSGEYYSSFSIKSNSAARHVNRLGRHMHEHLMAMIIDEDEFSDADVAHISMCD